MKTLEVEMKHVKLRNIEETGSMKIEEKLKTEIKKTQRLKLPRALRLLQSGSIKLGGDFKGEDRRPESEPEKKENRLNRGPWKPIEIKDRKTQQGYFGKTRKFI